MFSTRTRRIFLTLSLLAGFGAAPGWDTPADALPLKITVIGNVTTSDVPDTIATDAPIKFTVTYDNTLPFTTGTPPLIALHASPTSVWSIQAGLYATSGLGGGFFIHDNFLGGDVFGGTISPLSLELPGTFAPGSDVSGLPLSQVGFTLTDTTNSLWSNLNLPAVTFTGFNQTLMQIVFFKPGSGFGTDLQVLANIHTFTIEPAVTPTPLPAALPLFATGLGALGLVAYRRRRKKIV